MDGLRIDLVKPLVWAVAVILFIIGGYSDTNTTELWGWGFALAVGGALLDHVPGLIERK